jgi:putative FmdB family regulatory protein
MPVYDYSCNECGVFTASRPMSEYKAPATCPTCGAQAERVFVTAPAVAGMDAGARTAMASSERSAGEPTRGGHGAGCACCSGVSKVSRRAAG